MKTVIFTLASARTGTLYLRTLFKHNAKDCVCRHEPFFDWGNPTLFGRAIYDAHAGRWDRIRALLVKKRAYIERLGGKAYLETSHAFLKSAYVAALDVFPELQLIHLIRDPMKVARSEAYRQQWRQRLHVPFHHYRGLDGQRHFAWALTGNEEIFQSVGVSRASLFQWCFLQWIEIENRAIRFLDEHGLHDRCFTLHAPGDLNDVNKLASLFEFLELATPQPLILSGRKNRCIGGTPAVTLAEEEQCEAILKRLPEHYLDIFHREPYLHLPWSARLRRQRTSPDAAMPLAAPNA
jgi:hypothetical protein